MPMQDGFDPDHSLPQFLVERAGQDVAETTGETSGGSRLIRTTMLIAIAMATGVAVLAIGDPITLVADVSMSLLGKPSSHSTPVTRMAADEPAANPPAGNTQTDAPPAAAVTPQEPAGETLFKQFQAWAVEQDARGPGQPAQSTPAQAAPKEVQTAPAPIAQDVPAPRRLTKKRPQVREVRNARAELRTQSLRKPIRRAHLARATAAPAQDSRAQDRTEDPRLQGARAQPQDQSAPAAQSPSFLPIFGQRN